MAITGNGGDAGAGLALHGRSSPRAISSDVRRHNLSVIARLLATDGPKSRSGLAKAAGLTRGAVTALSSALIDAGVIREVTPTPQPGTKGRPNTLLALAADSAALLVLQLDADRATALAATVAGETIFRIEERHHRPMGDPDRILDVLAGVLDRALAECAKRKRTVSDLTVITFAPVGGDPVVVLADTDLDWGEVDVLGGLRNRVPAMPEARLTSDAAVAAVAELGLLGRIDDALYLKSNSGIGGAAVSGGRVVTGTNGMAGAFGHIPIDHDGALCACGQRGCLVTVAGPDAILEAAGMQTVRDRDGLTAALYEFAQRIERGDREASAAWSTASSWIAHALWVLTLSFDPQIVVLGGYWSSLTDSIDREFKRGGPAILGAGSYEPPAVVAGRLGSDAALVGAVWAARERVLDDPLSLP